MCNHYNLVYLCLRSSHRPIPLNLPTKTAKKVARKSLKSISDLPDTTSRVASLVSCTHRNSFRVSLLFRTLRHDVTHIVFVNLEGSLEIYSSLSLIRADGV